MTLLKQVKTFVVAAAALFAFAQTANAVIVLSPSSPNVIAGYGYGPSNCEPGCVETVFGVTDLNLLYKSESSLYPDFWPEEGPYENSYATLFYNSLSDPSNAYLFYTGGSAISCTSCYLAIKDGNSSPGYYFYDLSGWNGYEDISLQDFWPQQGAISHISIWGTSTAVPEPATLGLLGLGLLGIGMARRRQGRT